MVPTTRGGLAVARMLAQFLQVLGGAWQVLGCHNGTGYQSKLTCAPSSSVALMRCCSNMPQAPACQSVCWPAYIDSCAQDPARHGHRPLLQGVTQGVGGRRATWDEARRECAAHGRRLCTRVELASGICCKTGCRADQGLVWSNDSCVLSLKGPLRGAAAHTDMEVLPGTLLRQSAERTEKCAREMAAWFNARQTTEALSCSQWRGIVPRPVRDLKNKVAAVGGNRSCGVLWFTHVGKTGGTTVSKILEEGASRNKWQHIRTWSGGRQQLRDAPVGTGLYAKIDKLAGAAAVPRLVVDHHLEVPSLAEPRVLAWIRRLRSRLEARGCQLLVTTMLREPIARAKSNLAYGSFAPRQTCEFVRENSNWQARAFSPTYNKDASHITYAQSLREKGPVNGSDALAALLEVYDLVGVTERMSEFIKALRDQLGWRNEPIGSHEQIANPTEQCKKIQLTHEQQWWLHLHNLEDAVLYRAVCSQAL